MDRIAVTTELVKIAREAILLKADMVMKPMIRRTVQHEMRRAVAREIHLKQVGETEADVGALVEEVIVGQVQEIARKLRAMGGKEIDGLQEKYTNNEEQWYSRRNEAEFAKRFGGKATGVLAPIDVEWKDGKHLHGIELKTILGNAYDKLKMDPRANELKEHWAKETGGIVHTVVLDDTDVVPGTSRRGRTEAIRKLMKGDGSGFDASKRRVYYKRGHGSFRLSAMELVEGNIYDQLRKLMRSSEEEKLFDDTKSTSPTTLIHRVANPKKMTQQLVDKMLPIMAIKMGEAAVAQMMQMGIDPRRKKAVERLGEKSNPYHDADGRFASSPAMAPDAGGGSGGSRARQGTGRGRDWEEGGVAFHGTTEKKLNAILKDGIQPQKAHVYHSSYYSGERAKSVYVIKASKKLPKGDLNDLTGDYGLSTAQGYARDATEKFGGKAVVLIIKIPKGESLKVDQEATTALTGMGRAYYRKSIPPEWIVGYQKLPDYWTPKPPKIEPIGKIKKSVVVDDLMFYCVILLE